MIRELCSELELYASDNKLMGWQQKVEVELMGDASWSLYNDENNNNDNDDDDHDDEC